MKKIFLWALPIAAAALLLGLQLPYTAIKSYIENGDILTMEAQYSAEQIMDAQSSALLGQRGRAYHSAKLNYLPYLLMQVKYPMGDKGETVESALLWSLTDGEVLIDTDSWAKSHGYGDAMAAGATRTDYMVVHAIARRGGSATVGQLTQDLHLEDEALEAWLAAARKKHLIVQKGSLLQLHFERPRLLTQPKTHISQDFVSRPYSHQHVLPGHYSSESVVAAAKAAFGSDLAVRESKVVYLPLYTIEVQNSDGSILTSYWNAINGQRIKNM